MSVNQRMGYPEPKLQEPTDDQVWKMLDAWYVLIGRRAEPSADARQRDFDRMKRSIESFERSRKE